MGRDARGITIRRSAIASAGTHGVDARAACRSNGSLRGPTAPPRGRNSPRRSGARGGHRAPHRPAVACVLPAGRVGRPCKTGPVRCGQVSRAGRSSGTCPGSCLASTTTPGGRNSSEDRGDRPGPRLARSLIRYGLRHRPRDRSLPGGAGTGGNGGLARPVRVDPPPPGRAAERDLAGRSHHARPRRAGFGRQAGTALAHRGDGRPFARGSRLLDLRGRPLGDEPLARAAPGHMAQGRSGLADLRGSGCLARRSRQRLHLHPSPRSRRPTALPDRPLRSRAPARARQSRAVLRHAEYGAALGAARPGRDRRDAIQAVSDLTGTRRGDRRLDHPDLPRPGAQPDRYGAGRGLARGRLVAADAREPRRARPLARQRRQAPGRPARRHPADGPALHRHGSGAIRRRVRDRPVRPPRSRRDPGLSREPPRLLRDLPGPLDRGRHPRRHPGRAGRAPAAAAAGHQGARDPAGRPAPGGRRRARAPAPPRKSPASSYRQLRLYQEDD